MQALPIAGQLEGQTPEKATPEDTQNFYVRIFTWQK